MIRLERCSETRAHGWTVLKLWFCAPFVPGRASKNNYYRVPVLVLRSIGTVPVLAVRSNRRRNRTGTS
jgi:hypothetical protein